MQEVQPEFSRPLSLDDIEVDGTYVSLEAGPGERQLLADRFDLLSLEMLTAELLVTRAADGVPIRVFGRLKARVAQRCVVSLQPVQADIGERIEVEYGPPLDDAHAEDISLEEADIEPLIGDRIDLGELVAQHLSVALDPYPRLQGAAPPDWMTEAEKTWDSAAESPFAALEALRKKRY